jgi:hypothetical protein
VGSRPEERRCISLVADLSFAIAAARSTGRSSTKFDDQMNTLSLSQAEVVDPKGLFSSTPSQYVSS